MTRPEVIVDFDLSESHLALQQRVRAFARREVAPHAAEWDATGTFPSDVVRKIGKLGLFGLPFSSKHGGQGADFLSVALAVEELARADVSVAVTTAVAIALAGTPIDLFGTEEQKERWLAPLARGECVGAFGLTEPEAGSDAANCSTAARLDADSWVIDGQKIFTSSAGNDLSAFVVLTATTGVRPDGRKEISNFIVPKGTPGYTFSEPFRKVGWRASDTRLLTFQDCRIPANHLLGERGAGFRQFMATLDNGRITVAAISVGVAQAALDLSVAHAKKRATFGRPIAEHQAIQFKIADMATEVELARLMTYKAAVLRDQGRPFAHVASMAKLFASETAVRAADAGLQIHGGYGYLDDYPISRVFRDARVLTIAEGTSEIQRGIIARRVLAEG